MFDLPTDTLSDKRCYRQLIKCLEQEGFYGYQYSVFVRVCADFADVDAVKIRLKGTLADFPGEIKALALTDKQFVAMEQINWKTKNKAKNQLSASTKSMIVI